MSYWGKSSLKACYFTELLEYCVTKKKPYFHRIEIVEKTYEIQRDNQWNIELPVNFESKKMEAVTRISGLWCAK
jgi:hypothetical protein